MAQKSSQNALYWVVILAALAALLFGACRRQETMETPITIVAIGPKKGNCSNAGDVAVRDAGGRVYTYDCQTAFARAVSNSRTVGDTIK